MRILLLIQDTGKLYGAERATLDLASGLRAAGDDVRVLLIEERRLGGGPSAFREALSAAGVPFLALPVAGRFSFPLIMAIRAEVRRSGADILHCSGYKADLHGGWAAGWGRRFPAVSTVHGWLFREDRKERLYAWLNLGALRRFSRVIALTAFYEQRLAEWGVPAVKIVRIPTGFDLSSCPPGDEPPAGTPYTIGIAGRLSEEKNHEMFLQAARRALDAGAHVRFLVAGDGPLRSRLASRLTDLSLDSSVTLAGFLPREEFLARVHAVVLCSRIENLPYAMLEAMAWSRPVIATRVGGMPEVIEDGVTGWLVEPDDVAALAAHFARLAVSPESGRVSGVAGRERLALRFSLGAMVGAHRTLYAALTAPEAAASRTHPRLPADG